MIAETAYSTTPRQANDKIAFSQPHSVTPTAINLVQRVSAPGSSLLVQQPIVQYESSTREGDAPFVGINKGIKEF